MERAPRPRRRPRAAPPTRRPQPAAAAALTLVSAARPFPAAAPRRPRKCGVDGDVVMVRAGCRKR